MGNDEKKSSAVQKTAEIAGTVQGAIKTGKALAGSAKGAALGPYGFAALLAWENRKLIGKILAASLLILFLPILYIMMLPTLIFGDLNTETNVLNDNSIISDNIMEAETQINSILTAAHTIVSNQINSSAGNLPEDTVIVIIDNYENEVLYNSSLLISQYCASKEDYEEINISNLSSLISAHKNELFSYTSSSTTVTQEDETEITTVTYTVNYKGQSYFAENVFNLTDEQTVISSEYAYNLAILLGEEYSSNASDNQKRLSPYYIQNPYSGTLESFGSPFPNLDWYGAVTSYFGYRVDPITGEQGSYHSGLDMGFPEGTEIHAVMSGVVLYSIKSTGSYGYYTSIDHGNGIVTLYAHCSKLLVTEGQIVSKGDVIAEVGSTGRSTGNHLHFTVIVDGEYENPLSYIY